MAYRTRSPTRSELTHVISTACDRDQLAYCSHSKAHNLAQGSPIENIKVPFWSAINLLSGSVLISVSLHCGISPIYAEPVTYTCIYTSNTSVTEDLLLVEVGMGAVPAWVGRDCPAEDTTWTPTLVPPRLKKFAEEAIIYGRELSQLQDSSLSRV